MLRKTALLRSLVPLAVAGVALAGCSGGGGAPADTPEAPADAALRVNWGEFPENWSPGQEMEGGLLRVPYETLLAVGDDGQPAPFLAEAYELTDDAITLTLRQGVTFHDGTAFDAEAVKANVEYVKAGATAYAATLAAIASVDVVDEFTVRFNLTAPTPSIAQTLTTRALPMASPAALEDGTIAQNPVGTSPWAYDPDRSVLGTKMYFAAYEDYWGEAPGFADVELYAIAENDAAVAALQSGEIDVSDIEVTSLATLEGSAIDTLQYPAIRNNLIFFDRGEGGVFASQELRQAVCYAIDVEQMVEVEGEGESATQHFAEGELGYNPDIEGYPTDIEAAQELYEEAGSPVVSAEMVAAPYNETQITIFMEQVKAALSDVSVSVSTLPPPQFSAEWNSGRYPLGLASNDELTPYEWYSAWFAADAPGNPSGAESAELKAAADAAIAAGDSEEAADLWAEVTKIISDEALTCAHARGVETLAWNTETVSGVAAPAERWEPNLVNYRDLEPVA
ncbi:ABC transporter substrate-binding protein [Microbacterium oryzae]|uniref:ABC transporter substrate-binding protein n=1 Tax=Microbacterium oryzae TaxID=743009 RepID=UPI0025B009E1|nr:ABC transporter substrate-binding protein [Microbacterium oryzae]MDN3310340.1 ABC transporter substrate-binding protein [Microbacterium oryzae]